MAALLYVHESTYARVPTLQSINSMPFAFLFIHENRCKHPASPNSLTCQSRSRRDSAGPQTAAARRSSLLLFFGIAGQLLGVGTRCLLLLCVDFGAATAPRNPPLFGCPTQSRTQRPRAQKPKTTQSTLGRACCLMCC